MFALYVREAGGLRVNTDPIIPPLVPAVPVAGSLAPEIDRDTAGLQWGEWWRGLLLLGGDVDRVRLPEPREELRELADRPALRLIAQAVFRDAMAWTAARKREMYEMSHGPNGVVLAERDLIDDIARRRLFRRFPTFDLVVSELPVATAQGWRVAHNHVVVTRPLRADIGAYRAWLSPVIKDLAWR